jgi:hypothetical protein
MDTKTIPDTLGVHTTSPSVEVVLHTLRQSLWVSAFLARDLDEDLVPRISAVIVEVDRRIAELDLR